ncbi:prepilin-type N-terminal cleavage/methylation domain-containing protein [Desulfobulbus sp. US2]|nr:prepilin-type N-terminal cleavage/methylation domain-containing protein [Desulfobulbus sp. US4]MCW5208033.1 prepilin-type N-terminal cleavage/methylation domain-containing protein [Desulfobulbus sp. US2]
MKLNNLRAQANEKGFTLIELMIVIAIIGILAAVAIPNFIEYKNKSYCTATVNDVGAISGALADYFAISTNTTASTSLIPAVAAGSRPQLLVGDASAGGAGTGYAANTLLLSASTTWATSAAPPANVSPGAAAAGAYRNGSNYIIWAEEGAGNCPIKVTSSDTHWIDPASLAQATTPAGGTIGDARATLPSSVAFFKTL